MQIKRLRPRFGEFIPERLEPGLIYISIDYGTASHLCCCGCGSKVVTPLTPTDWSLTFNGEDVSLHPSVGNWEQACRSHYVLKFGRVIEHGECTRAEIEGSRARSRAAKGRYYGTASAISERSTPPKVVAADPLPEQGWLGRFWVWLVG